MLTCYIYEKMVTEKVVAIRRKSYSTYRTALRAAQCQPNQDSLDACYDYREARPLTTIEHE